MHSNPPSRIPIAKKLASSFNAENPRTVTLTKRRNPVQYENVSLKDPIYVSSNGLNAFTNLNHGNSLGNNNTTLNGNKIRNRTKLTTNMIKNFIPSNTDQFYYWGEE